MKTFARTFLLSLIFALPASAQNKPMALATTGMVADMVKNVAGDLLEVKTLMGPGVDPHLYKATQGDMRLLKQADIVFYNGLKLEGKMEEIFEKLSSKKLIVAIAAELDESLLLASSQYENAYDPHIWFDVSLWSRAVSHVEKVLIQMFPEHAEALRARATTYTATLSELDNWVTTEISKIPPDKRILITAHDAFHYFGRAYGVEVMGLQGISTASEFGLQDLKRISDVIIKKKVRSVFVETSVPEKFIISLKEGVLARGAEVEIGGSLFSDAMGESGTPEGTYLGMVKHNVNTIVEGLK